MTLSDNTIQVERLGDFKNLGKKDSMYQKNSKKRKKNNPRRALDFTANIFTAAASRNAKNVLSTLP